MAIILKQWREKWRILASSDTWLRHTLRNLSNPLLPFCCDLAWSIFTQLSLMLALKLLRDDNLSCFHKHLAEQYV
jgi:hypothetical protein